jgi:hypothetical protein
MSDTVAMLDHTDMTLHRPGNVHLRTVCGVHLGDVTIGPLTLVSERAERSCPECFPERSEP